MSLRLKPVQILKKRFKRNSKLALRLFKDTRHTTEFRYGPPNSEQTAVVVRVFETEQQYFCKVTSSANTEQFKTCERLEHQTARITQIDWTVRSNRTANT